MFTETTTVTQKEAPVGARVRRLGTAGRRAGVARPPCTCGTGLNADCSARTAVSVVAVGREPAAEARGLPGGQSALGQSALGQSALGQSALGQSRAAGGASDRAVFRGRAVLETVAAWLAELWAHLLRVFDVWRARAADQRGSQITDNLGLVVIGIVAIVAIGGLISGLDKTIFSWVTNQLGLGTTS